VFDPATRRLDYASAGHHAAYLVPAERGASTPLRTRNAMVGATPGRTYAADSADVPPGASLYLFSDGVFEIVTKAGELWSLRDFAPLLLAPLRPGTGEGERLYGAVMEVAEPEALEDDFTIVVLTFD
jgi:sigma-B regulation protein RsbU (phosphoserine phosphatase)